MDKGSILQIAICDDEEKAVSIIMQMVEKLFAEKEIPIKTDTFTSPDSLWTAMQTCAYNLLFLDISMGEVDGIKLGKKISEMECAPAIVFVSSKTERVFDSFISKPFGFVRKNNFVADLKKVLSRYITQNYLTEARSIEIKNNGAIIKLNIANLTYVECFRSYQVLHMANGETYKLYSTMRGLEENLQDDEFIRVHSSYIANCRYIKRLSRDGCVLESGETLAVGRTKYDKALDEYLDYIHRHGIKSLL